MDREELTNEEALDLQEIMRLIDTPPEEGTGKSDPAAEMPAADPVEKTTKEDSTSGKPKDADNNFQKNVVLYLHDLVVLMVTMVLLFLLCFRIVIVSGDSMFDTLVDGDYLLLLNNVFYSEPQQGDIIVASKESFDHGTPIVKRIIATEGQQVDIDFAAGVVYVDGEVLSEPYIYTPTKTPEGVSFPLTVDAGCVFVLGDNRAVSKDSRNPEIGLIDTRQIIGKAIFLLFPGNDGGTVATDFGRIGGIS